VNIVLLAGSLASILMLVGLARLLGLGGDVRLADHAAAATIADQHGFDAAAIIIDRAGTAALARDAAGRFLLIRRHGVHFVTQRLHPPVDGRLDHRFLTLGGTTLDLGDDAAVWAASLRRMVR
jgi:hypothetical protein